ncbi:disease resistance protein RUN1-like isoform X1 [Prosopis cineraria]|uniref:disease resistance protein RUN1-like isoform X1 n=1 Tax=Prosopis cineraria TaxID=364024 RepID=UPI00240F1558|nr:disease resistance protein RUN1-like isoform X1 [Prosopis cineraria]XP_054797825.1 disease resistance protein RUN1-like isoform X1 [Prosopis cineraria]XP_054797826.1 disease resistance protein RUN1-like isoform X1 [Prosopis cineraria]XP_054797827.1 disease resistance protein RUN1-like isoform X1 [Prosopis cineraria]XP_054797828.1 disease resistance protein RUN1-like isoform X1 [Prosopis cineraria]
MGLQNSKVDDSMQRKYDVFLSFDDEYIPYFVDDLIAALQRKGINTFRADKMLKKGKSVPPEILRAIGESQICIVVFTFNYAASVWCLRELAKIAKDMSKHRVFPVFYRVHPTEVQKQGKCYEGTFAEHEEKFRHNLDEVQNWRQAMKEVGSVKGWHVWNGSESEVIDSIVKSVMRTLDRNENDDLIGLVTRVEALKDNLQDLKPDDDRPRFVGVYGMSRTGKTCLAKAVYEEMSHHFKAHSFLFNVGRVVDNYSHGLIHLQKQLLCETGVEGDQEINDDEMGSSIIRDHLRSCKTLLVLDDINDPAQLKALAGNVDWFGPRSRIIIATRDESVLRNHGVEHVYKVKLLNEYEASQLLCTIAFKRNSPLAGYEKLTGDVLRYANGLPLVIKRLGSALVGQSPSEWTRVLEGLQEHPEKSIMLHLKSSLHGLKKEEMEIFFDIACFFNGEDESHVRRILYSCGHDDNGIRVLQDKSLINISDGKIAMHVILQQVGRQIIHEESYRNRGKRGRLWLIKDVLDVMDTEKGIKRVQAIVLKPEKLQDTPLRAEALSYMRGLVLMILHNVKFSGEIHHLSNELRYVSWDKYPFTRLPSTFEGRKLVELIMPNSSLRLLWEGIYKDLPNLRNLDLHGSKYLTQMPSFAGLRNLEILNLEGCIRLSQVDSSITALHNIRELNLRNCVGLASIPESLFGGREKLKILNLAGCSNLLKYFNFDPLRSSLDEKLLTNRYHILLAKFVLYFHLLFRLIN